MKGIIFTITCLLVVTTVFNWGPFPTCGPADPTNIDDCDKYSLRTGLGCCLAEIQSSPKSSKCILVGGKAQGFFNNSTDPINLNNLTFPSNVANRTAEASKNYTKMISDQFGSFPSAIIRCAKNNALALKLTSFLVILLLMIFL